MCALLFVPAAAGGPLGGSSSSEEPERDGRLWRLHAAIERTFQRCDASLLKTAFSPRVKTFLSARALGVRQGYYGADQALLILRRGFEGRTTLRFKLGAPDDAAQQAGRRVIPARWLYRDEGASISERRLSFTLAPEGAAWFIPEIREMK
jgi:hypothetical protein